MAFMVVVTILRLMVMMVMMVVVPKSEVGMVMVRR